jgi:hypothetical protein
MIQRDAQAQIVAEDKTLESAKAPVDSESIESLISMHKNKLKEASSSESDEEAPFENKLKSRKRDEALNQLVEENRVQIVQKSNRAI